MLTLNSLKTQDRQIIQVQLKERTYYLVKIITVFGCFLEDQNQMHNANLTSNTLKVEMISLLFFLKIVRFNQKTFKRLIGICLLKIIEV